MLNDDLSLTESSGNEMGSSLHDELVIYGERGCSIHVIKAKARQGLSWIYFQWQMGKSTPQWGRPRTRPCCNISTGEELRRYQPAILSFLDETIDEVLLGSHFVILCLGFLGLAWRDATYVHYSFLLVVAISRSLY